MITENQVLCWAKHASWQELQPTAIPAEEAQEREGEGGGGRCNGP